MSREMSAGIRINANACWLKADWLAQYVADELRSECTPAVAARLEEVGKWPGAIADFCSASAEEMIDVRNVLLLLIERMQCRTEHSQRSDIFPRRAERSE